MICLKNSSRKTNPRFFVLLFDTSIVDGNTDIEWKKKFVLARVDASAIDYLLLDNMKGNYLNISTLLISFPDDVFWTWSIAFSDEGAKPEYRDCVTSCPDRVVIVGGVRGKTIKKLFSSVEIEVGEIDKMMNQITSAFSITVKMPVPRLKCVDWGKWSRKHGEASLA